VREGAYLLAKFVRFIPLKDPQSYPHQRHQVVTFIYNNLEQFEMFEKINGELKTDVAPVQTPAAHLANLRKHAEAIGCPSLFA
jgi:hypothetical protein